MGEAEKTRDMPTIDAKDIERMLYKQADLVRAYGKLCLKCEKGVLLPVDHVMDLGQNPISEELAKRYGRGLSLNDLEDLTKHLGTVRVWKCSNPTCDYEVK